MPISQAAGAAQTTPSPAPQASPAPAPPLVVPAKGLPATKPVSNYLQCDGAPNNVTGGEKAARLLGALTLLALFAPTPESFDASKRKLGAEGVAACTTLIDGEKKEGNPARRVQLILARAIHRIEAKDYNAAIDDVALAEREAGTAGLTANPFFNRSQGRAFGLIRSAALFRLDRPAEARAAALATAPIVSDLSIALEAIPDYRAFLREGSPAEEEVLRLRTQNRLVYVRDEAERLEEIGKFAEAAVLRDALRAYNGFMVPDAPNSLIIAEAGLAHALAGDLSDAKALATASRTNFDRNKAAGKPDNLGSEFIEVLDLLNLTITAQTDVKMARRLFSARSEWPNAPFGAVMEMNRRLRAGAAAEDLIGGLAKTPDQLFADRAAAVKAVVMAADTDNRTLWILLPRTIDSGSYYSVSKKVWNTKKSPLLVASRPDEKYEVLMLPYADSVVQREAFKLHAALLAKARGKQGFTIAQMQDKDARWAGVLIGNPGDPGLSGPLFNDADAVISRLSPIIPTPEQVAALKTK